MTRIEDPVHSQPDPETIDDALAALEQSVCEFAQRLELIDDETTRARVRFAAMTGLRRGARDARCKLAREVDR